MAGSKSKLGKTFAWILMTFVIIGLGGFGAVNFSSSNNTVASVGETEISSTEYARALSNELRRFSSQLGQEIKFEQAQAFGITGNVLSQLITAKSLEDEAKRIGISVNDEIIVTSLSETSAFQGLDGKFDKETYTFVLENAGMTPSMYEDVARAETSRMILQSGITKGVTVPEGYLKIMAKYMLQTRDFELVSLNWKDLNKSDPEPTEEELTTYHLNKSDQYMRPETKLISYVLLTPIMLSRKIEIEESNLEEAYEERISEFNEKEKRRTEKLVFFTLEEAEDALNSIKNQVTSFESLVNDRGLTLNEIDIGFLTKPEFKAAANGVFEANLNEVVGPFETDLGPSLFRLVEIKEAKTSTFNAVKAKLIEELALSEATSGIAKLSQEFDDLLASGATLEELANETSLELYEIAYSAKMEDNEVTKFEGFRAEATAISATDFPKMITLADGSVAALRLDQTLEPALKPLDEVYQSVSDDWIRDKRNEVLKNEAQLYISNGDIASMEPTQFEEIARDSFSDKTPPALLATVFEMSKDEYRIEKLNDTYAIIHLLKIKDGVAEKPEEVEILESLETQIKSTLSQDLFRIMISDIQTSRGITVDESAINAVHLNFQ
jgi:peptidyl-prolyl cis-trans isomerase D